MWDANILPSSGQLDSAPQILFAVLPYQSAEITCIRLVNTDVAARQVWVEFNTMETPDNWQPIFPYPLTLDVSFMASDNETLKLKPNQKIRAWADASGVVKFTLFGTVASGT